MPAMAAQPVPLKPAAMDGNGTLLPPAGMRPPPLTDQHPAALAAAWSPSEWLCKIGQHGWGWPGALSPVLGSMPGAQSGPHDGACHAAGMPYAGHDAWRDS